MDVSGAEAEFSGAGAQEDTLGGVEALELGGDFEGAVGRGVVDDDDFVVEVVFGKGAIKKPDDDGEITALIVGWEDYSVFIFRCHVCDLLLDEKSVGG